MRRMARACVVAIAAAAVIGFGTTVPAQGAELVPSLAQPSAVAAPLPQPGPTAPADPSGEAPASDQPAPVESSPTPEEAPQTPTPTQTPTPVPDPQPQPSEGPGQPAPEPAPTPNGPDEAAPLPLASALAEITPFPAGVYRLAGAERFETAVAISQRFAPKVPVLYVATGLDFPDALTAAAAAAQLGGPLLLTRPDALPAAVRTEIERLAPARIVVAGGEGVVGAAVYAELMGLTPSISRIGGINRFETAERLNADAFDAATEAFVATSRDFPDALAASAAAGQLNAPVVLVDGLAQAVRSTTVAALRSLGVQRVRIAGATGAVSSGIQRQFALSGFTVSRYEGVDRYLTAAAINEAVFGSATALPTAFIATGSDFADALAGAALAGGLGAPLYITRPECIPHPVSVALNRLAPAARVILGGTGAVGEPVAKNTACAMVWAKPAAGRITDGFGPRPPICTPSGCSQSFHRGIDIGTGCGAPIYAASGGRVSSAGLLGTYGNFVKIAHGSGIDTGYAHLVDGGVLVRAGQIVRAGQQIGWSGATGAATGCHLHFEVYQGGTQIDPAPFMLLRGIRLG